MRMKKPDELAAPVDCAKSSSMRIDDCDTVFIESLADNLD